MSFCNSDIMRLAAMPSRVEHYRGYRIAIYSPTGHFAVVTPPGSNAVIEFGAQRPASSVVEGSDVCLDRAKAAVDSIAGGTDA